MKTLDFVLLQLQLNKTTTHSHTDLVWTEISATIIWILVVGFLAWLVIGFLIRANKYLKLRLQQFKNKSGAVLLALISMCFLFTSCNKEKDIAKAPISREQALRNVLVELGAPSNLTITPAPLGAKLIPFHNDREFKTFIKLQTTPRIFGSKTNPFKTDTIVGHKSHPLHKADPEAGDDDVSDGSTSLTTYDDIAAFLQAWNMMYNSDGGGSSGGSNDGGGDGGENYYIYSDPGHTAEVYDPTLFYMGHAVKFSWDYGYKDGTYTTLVSNVTSGLYGMTAGITWAQDHYTVTTYPGSSLVYMSVSGMESYGLNIQGFGNYATWSVTVNIVFNTNNNTYTTSVTIGGVKGLLD